MSQTATSIELVDYHETTIPALAAKPLGAAKIKDTPSIADDLRPIHESPETFAAEQRDGPGKGTTAIVLVTVVCVTLVSSMLSGVMTVTLPTVARELELAPSVLLWYLRLRAVPYAHANTHQAYLYLRPDMWLYSSPSRIGCRCCRFTAHVPDRLSLAVCVYTSMWIGTDRDTAHCLPRLCRHRDFLLPSLSSQYHHQYFS